MCSPVPLKHAPPHTRTPAPYAPLSSPSAPPCIPPPPGIPPSHTLSTVPLHLAYAPLPPPSAPPGIPPPLALVLTDMELNLVQVLVAALAVRWGTARGRCADEHTIGVRGPMAGGVAR